MSVCPRTHTRAIVTDAAGRRIVRDVGEMDGRENGSPRESFEECEIGDWKVANASDPIVPGLVVFEEARPGVPEKRAYFKRLLRLVEGKAGVVVWLRVAKPVHW